MIIRRTFAPDGDPFEVTVTRYFGDEGVSILRDGGSVFLPRDELRLVLDWLNKPFHEAAEESA